MESTHVASPDISELELLSGHLSLDFANTVDRDRSGGTRHEYLLDYHTVAAWARHAGVIDDHTFVRLINLASEDTAAASEVFKGARDLRAAIQRIFTALASNVAPAPADLDTLRSHYLRAIEMSQLRGNGSGFHLESIDGADQLDQVVWPVAIVAVDLLRFGRLERLKRCPGDDGHCGWLFLDTTKNGSRRWCSMQTCGSRDKMRRLYQRQHRSNSQS